MIPFRMNPSAVVARELKSIAEEYDFTKQQLADKQRSKNPDEARYGLNVLLGMKSYAVNFRHEIHRLVRRRELDDSEAIEILTYLDERQRDLEQDFGARIIFKSVSMNPFRMNPRQNPGNYNWVLDRDRNKSKFKHPGEFEIFWNLDAGDYPDWSGRPDFDPTFKIGQDEVRATVFHGRRFRAGKYKDTVRGSIEYWNEGPYTDPVIFKIEGKDPQEVKIQIIREVERRRALTGKKNPTGLINVRVVNTDGSPTRTFQIEGDTVVLFDHLSDHALDALDAIWDKVYRRVRTGSVLRAERDWPSRTLTFYVR